MDKRFILFLIVSFVIHIIVLFFLYYYFINTKLEFSFKEESIKIKLNKINTNDKKRLYKIKKSDLGKVKSVQGYKSSISESIIDTTVDFSISENIYSYEQEKVYSKNVKHISKNLFQDEDFFKYAKKEINDLNEKQREGIYFLDGSKRALINNYIEEFQNLNIDANIKFKAKLEIDKNGDVIKVELVESSGDIQKDSNIIAILKKWNFEKNEKLIQVVIVELKYLLN